MCLPWGKVFGCTKYRNACTILNKIPIAPGSWYAPVSYVLAGTNPKSKVPGGGLYIGCTSEIVLPQNSSSSKQSSTAIASSIHKTGGRGICPTKSRNPQHIHLRGGFLARRLLVHPHTFNSLMYFYFRMVQQSLLKMTQRTISVKKKKQLIKVCASK